MLDNPCKGLSSIGGFGFGFGFGLRFGCGVGLCEALVVVGADLLLVADPERTSRWRGGYILGNIV